MRGHRVMKFLRSITLLAQPCGITMDELGRKLEIQSRQVYRLIDSVKDDWGFVLKEERLDGGSKRLSLAVGQSKPL